MSAVLRRNLVRALQVAVGGLPDKDYPPANVAQMIKQCEDAGRSDLGQQIMMQWNKVIEKYPQARRNWGAAVKIGGNSINKNIFNRVGFAQWFAEQESLSPEVKKEIKSIPTISSPPKGTPKIAIPTDSETPEDWSAEAAKTQQALSSIREAFSDHSEYVREMNREITDLKKKIKVYGPGGAKELTGKGQKSKLSLRVPKWEGQLGAFETQLKAAEAAISEAEADIKTAETAYASAPVTTVAYEKKAQKSLDSVLNHILDMDDLEKQAKMLEKFNETLEKLKGKATAHLATADIWSAALALFEKIITAIKSKTDSLAAKIKGLNASVNEFSELANIR